MIALIADIHANLAALQAVLRRLDNLGVREIICLGDIAGYGPQINECCELLQQRSVVGVKGNHDHYLLTGTSSGRSVTADMCIRYQASTITDQNLHWLGSFPLTLTSRGINIVHGGWADPLDQYLYSVNAKMFEEVPGKRFASGHTHIPLLWEGEDKMYCNPGSVGQPRDGDPRASFALLETGRFRIEKVAYDVRATQTALAESGLPDYVGASLPLGLPPGSHRRNQ